MFGIDTRRKVFLYSKPCDMRKGFNGLHGLALNAMEMDVRCGDLFVFVSRARNKAKILYWDTDGLVLLYKRLEKGTFKRPTARLDAPNCELCSAGYQPCGNHYVFGVGPIPQHSAPRGINPAEIITSLELDQACSMLLRGVPALRKSLCLWSWTKPTAFCSAGYQPCGNHYVFGVGSSV